MQIWLRLNQSFRSKEFLRVFGSLLSADSSVKAGLVLKVLLRAGKQS